MSSLVEAVGRNIRYLHEIQNIIDNEDIPMSDRLNFLAAMCSFMKMELSAKQMTMVNVFLDQYVKIDKDIRVFRTVLNLVINLAEHYKFDNTSVIYAFKNLSLQEHFLNFVDFSKRKNPIVKRDSPIHLILVLGCSILKLALQKEKSHETDNSGDNSRHLHDVNLLRSEYNTLRHSMNSRFLNLDVQDLFNVPSTSNPNRCYKQQDSHHQQSSPQHTPNHLHSNIDDDDYDSDDSIKSSTKYDDISKKVTTLTTTAVIHPQSPVSTTPIIVEDISRDETTSTTVVNEIGNDNDNIIVVDNHNGGDANDGSVANGGVGDKDGGIGDDVVLDFEKMYETFTNKATSIVASNQIHNSTDAILKTLDNGRVEVDIGKFEADLTAISRRLAPSIVPLVTFNSDDMYKEKTILNF
jgi:hypothetical protein